MWENKLRRIERGAYSASEFIDELKELISGIVSNVLNDNSMKKIDMPQAATSGAKEDAGKSDLAETKPKAKRKPPIKSLEQIVCPLCGKGHLLKGRTAYGCSEFRQGCSLRLSFDEFPESLTPSKLNASIKKHFK